ncbi:kynureninase [Sulfitobacter sp. M57]|uniref:kynureninase n=1 Tax=unclassified Sulfitobacter TaxID=196795 RepID=UPI0023E0C2AA|nr:MULTISPECIES: kynureninase [unclassified Sulfitobacter]MDF3413389.1 kynureninase [Sulfitobacter sp. KE5]MDF3421331.1 kynureninase [Sulfitobacter sp. KE43]MDF3431936.1 kynureninase [Sulfitobacter sp. KE42]MDF3457576.1 kynureninase [Sulfitobacter sp. S74]MDF3461478.1 kynureninase [Sulfitobacter sp. Ks18]
MTNVVRKEQFILPEGVIYLDGNSLGPMPKSVPARLANVMNEEWAQMLIGGWNKAGWMAQPSEVGNSVGRLVGAAAGSVVMGDTLSVKVYQALAAGIKMRPERRVILSDTGNFPSDLYMAEGLVGLLGQGYELRTVAPEEVAKSITDDIAVVMLTQVDYRSGRVHDMPAMTKLAHDAGAVMVWDLAHSAGAIPVDLAASNCEFAVGCTYKYLNGGPGAPAFIYVRPDLADTAEPALSGWLGHANPFDFDLHYTPGKGIERMRVGTPPVLQMAALEEAMKVWDGVDMADVRQASIALQEQFIEEVEQAVPELELASPRDSSTRGSQVSFRFEHGYAAMQAVIERGVVGDFRAPDIMRFGFTPLYLDSGDVSAAVAVIKDVMTNALWDDPKYKVRSRVT